MGSLGTGSIGPHAVLEASQDALLYFFALCECILVCASKVVNAPASVELAQTKNGYLRKRGNKKRF